MRDESLMMSVAGQRHRVLCTSSSEGSSVLVNFCADLMTLCGAVLSATVQLAYQDTAGEYAFNKAGIKGHR